MSRPPLLFAFLAMAPAALPGQATPAVTDRAAALSQLTTRVVERFGATNVIDRRGDRTVLRLQFLDRRYRRLGPAMDDSMNVVLRFVAAHTAGAYRPDSIDIEFLVRDTVMAGERHTSWLSRTYPAKRKP